MDKLVLIDGNSIINRAFYGIMGNKMLSVNGKPTNAVYGFLSIYFKIIEDINPNYVAVAFDVKAPTKRHELYKEYKATRKGMPNELAEQMPVLKEILSAMNITIVEKEGYEADDILGTLAKYGKRKGLDVTVLTGDRDYFQLIEPNITIRIPRTRAGKTETEDYNTDKIQEEYGLLPEKLIEVKGLMGDTSDNIPGVPGIGEKTAIDLIKKYGSIDNLYKKLEKSETDLTPKVKQKLEENKELAYISRTLGIIDINANIEKNLDKLIKQDWNVQKVYELFTKLKFNRYIERFELSENNSTDKQTTQEFKMEELKQKEQINCFIDKISQSKTIYYYLDTVENMDDALIIKKDISGIYVYDEVEKATIYINYRKKLDDFKNDFTKIFENKEILKCGQNLKQDICILMQNGVEPQNFMFDVSIAGYVLDATKSKYNIEELSYDYLKFDFSDIKGNEGDEQINLFDEEQTEDKIDEKKANYVQAIYKLHNKLTRLLKKEKMWVLFKQIEMPLVEVLANMQYTGIFVDKEELIKYGEELKVQIDNLKKEIYNFSGKEFNINSPKQLGEILFEELKLPVQRKTKSGYSTDSEVLEKLKNAHPIIANLLEYRKLTKLNSTYVEGIIPFINKSTHRIHSCFHQTVTATGRISSTEPNLQNIPTRNELGQKIRMSFMPQQEKDIYLDADYSQIELRILSHFANDVGMIEAFKKGEDIHKEVASKVFDVPLEEVTKELRRKAKAVNFGIVYGISDFGLSEQLDIPRREAKNYIEQYMEKYKGISDFMQNIQEIAKEKGYAETLFKRRRYIPELNSSNYMVRQFGARVAMNMPIQGTAADIMKIAMINVYKELKNANLKSKLILQVHDELIIETTEEEKNIVKNILKNCMENVINLSVPLEVEVGEGKNWYEAK